MILKYVVDEETGGKTIKYILKNKLELSERLVKKLKYGNKVLCNSLPVHINAPVEAGDIIEAVMDLPEDPGEIIPEKIEIDILYEDDCIIALNKQPHRVVHPTSGHPSGTIANAVMYYLFCKDEPKKIRPVNRLDRDTSGVIIFAKNQYVQEALIKQMQDHTFKKEYLGIVCGLVENRRGTINLPITRKPGSIMLRHVSPDGSPAVTHYEVLEYLENASLLKFRLETGRTHQIRVHCQALGHPILGDTLYPFHENEGCPSVSGQAGSGNIMQFIDRQALHSHKTSLIHPITKKSLEIEAPIPEDMKQVLEILRK
ncbi:MAG: RluA family pseudouridine synthase [Clostridiales bacterium]|nr:RluA family pseudouridine synthase [Eubacteriales bacterium]MDH7565217.1 RluA family pseudouridine synthase [Clostridiales bacterium]